MQNLDNANDVPDVVFLDRRHTPERRSFWRGGRRNTDWLKRSLGGWQQFEQRLGGWRHWLAKLPITGLRAH